MYIEIRKLRGGKNLLKHQLCAGIVSVELWCPRIVSPPLLLMKLVCV